MRPRKQRFIRFDPNVTYFKPAGVPMRNLEEVNLSYDEAEALRLKYLKELDQEKAAEMMKISRSTFQRTLSEALTKVTDFIINGKALRVNGGNFTFINKQNKNQEV